MNLQNKFSDIEFRKIDFINLRDDSIKIPEVFSFENQVKYEIPSNAQNLKISVLSDQKDIDFVLNQYKTNRDFDFDFTKFKSSEIELKDLNSSYKIVHAEFKTIPESLIGKEIFENFDVKGVLKGYSLIPLNFEYSSKIDLNNEWVSDINCSVNSINIFDKKNDSIDSHMSFIRKKMDIINNDESLESKKLDLNLDLHVENNFYKSNLHFDGMIYPADESIFIRDFHIDMTDQEDGKECMNFNLKNGKMNFYGFFENQIDNFFDFNTFVTSQINIVVGRNFDSLN